MVRAIFTIQLKSESLELSAISYQLSAISYQLSAISTQKNIKHVVIKVNLLI
ncbi:MAG: hypothetical protein ACJAUK_001562 [Colwellia polaris]|jgi:hypothetical protein